MEDTNDDICEWFQAFSIIVVWNVDSMKLCKLSFVLNNPNTLKNLVPSYSRIFNTRKKYGLSLANQA
jgi:hypothetical protein